MVAFDSITLVGVVIVGLIMYPLGVVIIDYFAEAYNNTCVQQGVGNQQIVDGFNWIILGWQNEPLATILCAALASVVVGTNRRAGAR